MSRNILLLTAAISTLCVAAPQSRSAETTPIATQSSPAAADLQDLVGRIRLKLRDGTPTEASLATELKEFRALVTKHRSTDPEETAKILYLEAMLYDQVLKNEKKSEELLAELKKDFAETKQVQNIKRQEEGKKIRAGLVKGATFPDFQVTDLEGKPLSIAKYKGKVVLVDFWATWCGPCVAELPHVKETYEKHHKSGFEVVGISLDSQKEQLTSFLKKHDMPWPQFFDGQGWENELAQKYGIQSIPATFLIDGSGTIIGSDLRGDNLERAVAAALKK